MAKMVGAGVQLGDVGEAARRNLTRIRKMQGLGLAELAARMTGERQLSLSALSKIETGGRRIDVDDLVAISAALDVSPLAILFGAMPNPDELVQVGGTSTDAEMVWMWAVGKQPLLDLDARGFQARSLPWWLNLGAYIGLTDQQPWRDQFIQEHIDAEHPEAP